MNLKTICLCVVLILFCYGCDKSTCCDVKSSYCSCNIDCSSRTADGKVIDINLKLNFSSDERLEYSNYRMNDFKHAISITTPMYSYAQLKPARLDKMINSLAMEVFKDPRIEVIINSINFNP